MVAAPMRDGYAFEYNGPGEYRDGTSEDWDTVMVVPSEAKSCRFVGFSRIDGARVRVYQGNELGTGAVKYWAVSNV